MGGLKDDITRIVAPFTSLFVRLTYGISWFFQHPLILNQYGAKSSEDGVIFANVLSFSFAGRILPMFRMHCQCFRPSPQLISDLTCHSLWTRIPSIRPPIPSPPFSTSLFQRNNNFKVYHRWGKNKMLFTRSRENWRRKHTPTFHPIFFFLLTLISLVFYSRVNPVLSSVSPCQFSKDLSHSCKNTFNKVSLQNQDR